MNTVLRGMERGGKPFLRRGCPACLLHFLCHHQNTMHCTRACLLAAVCGLLWASSVEAGWNRKAPSQAFLLFSNTRWSGWWGQGGCRQPAPTATAAAAGLAALAHRPLTPPRPAPAHSTFDGLDQPGWRQHLERDVLPVLRRYNNDAPPPRVAVSGRLRWIRCLQAIAAYSFDQSNALLRRSWRLLRRGT